MQLTELVTRFSFVGSLDPLGKFHKGLSVANKALIGLTATVAVAGIAYAKFASNTLHAVAPLNALSKETGIAVGRIQALTFAAEQNDSSAQAMQSTLQGLTRTIGNAAQMGNATFSRLGISVRDAAGRIKTADEVLDQVRRRFQQLNLSLAERREFAGALGIDASLIQLLGKTDAQMASLTKRARDLGVLTNKQAEMAGKYTSAVKEMEFGLSAVKQQIAIGVAPELIKLTKGFLDWVTANREWITNAAGKVAEYLTTITESMQRLLPVIGLMVAGFVAWKIATIGLGKVLGVVFSPVVLIAVGIAALLLIVDDLIVAFNGGKSVIRDFFLEFFGWDITPVLQGIVKAFTDGLTWIRGLFTRFVNDVIAALSMIGEMFAKVFGGIFKGISGAVQSVGKFLGIAPGSTSTTSNVSNNTVQQNVNIDIKTDDPVAAGAAVGSALQRQLRDAETQTNRGGR